MHRHVGPFGDVLPGERHITDYRDGSLSLTDRRVLYRPKGPERDEFQSLSLSKVSLVGLIRRRKVQYALFSVPLILVLIGFSGAMIDGHPAPLIVFSLFALVTLPLPWLGRRPLAIHIAALNHRIEVPVPKRHRAEALDFVRAVEAARHADQEPEDPASTRVPTTHPFHG